MWIFISHSTDKGDDAGKQRLLDLQAELKGPKTAPSGQDVLLDFERLEPGSTWRVELDEWMATCHAAVLLLTPKAFESFWVLKEATVLAHRAARDPDFLLFPVLLDGLTPEQLTAKESRFSPLYLDAIQRVGTTEPAGIAAAVLTRLAALARPPLTPFDELADAIESHLRSAERTGLEAICRSLTGKPIMWLDADSRARRCAREVARAIVTGTKGTYGSLGDLMNALLLAGLPKETGTRILNLAAPLWVDSEAATPLADVAARNLTAKPDAAGRSTSWSAVINGDYVPTFTAEMYVRRAYLPRTATLLNIDGGESELRLEELVARIRNEVRATTPTLQRTTDAKIDTYLAALTRPYFIVLPPPFPDEDLLAALQDRYSKVTFIAQADADGLTAGTLAGRVVPLAPPLDLARELAALDEFNDASDRIKSA